MNISRYNNKRNTKLPNVMKDCNKSMFTSIATEVIIMEVILLQTTKQRIPYQKFIFVTFF